MCGRTRWRRRGGWGGGGGGGGAAWNFPVQPERSRMWELRERRGGVGSSAACGATRGVSWVSRVVSSPPASPYMRYRTPPSSILTFFTFSPPSSPPSSPPAFPFSAATVASATTGASPCAASTLAPPAASVDVRCSIIWLFERVTSNEKQRYFDTHGGQLQELQIQSRAHTHTPMLHAHACPGDRIREQDRHRDGVYRNG